MFHVLLPGDWQWQFWRGVPSQALRLGGDGRHQEGSPGQEIQEQGAADHAQAGPHQHRQSPLFLLHKWREEGRIT